MTTTLQHFGLAEDQIIRKDGNFYLPISKLSDILQTEKRNLLSNIRRNKEEFGELGVINLSTPSGNQDSLILDEEQIYILCMITRSSEKAKEFRRVFAKALKMIRSREFVHISELKAVQLELGLTQEKLFMKIEKASKKRVDRYFQLRAIGLSTVEAARAVKLRARPSARLEKTKALIAASQQPIKILEGL
jgi:prophage antirepressor-like protein